MDWDHHLDKASMGGYHDGETPMETSRNLASEGHTAFTIDVVLSLQKQGVNWGNETRESPWNGEPAGLIIDGYHDPTKYSGISWRPYESVHAAPRSKVRVSLQRPEVQNSYLAGGRDQMGSSTAQTQIIPLSPWLILPTQRPKWDQRADEIMMNAYHHGMREGEIASQPVANGYEATETVVAASLQRQGIQNSHLAGGRDQTGSSTAQTPTTSSSPWFKLPSQRPICDHRADEITMNAYRQGTREGEIVSQLIPNGYEATETVVASSLQKQGLGGEDLEDQPVPQQ